MRRAAEGGHGPAQFYMATVYRTQRDRDMAKAVEMYEKAAANGVPPAAMELGAVYRNGIGMPADGVRAVYWYEQAYSKFRFRDAAEALAAIYRSGLPGVAPDADKADFWSRQRDALKCPGTAGSVTVIC
jgi:TPR repeat protein